MLNNNSKNNNKNGVFRKKRVYFTQVSNNALRDNTLSLKAKGLYALIQSYLTIEDFTLYKKFLFSNCQEGESAFENAWKELKNKGYLIQYRLQDPETKCFYYEYELLDEKNVELAKEIHSKQNRKSKEEKTHTHKTTGMDKKTKKTSKAITQKIGGMAFRGDGKDGVYNNTIKNNTIKNNTNISISTSTENFETIKQLFEDSICTLGKTTEVKLLKYSKVYDYNFLKTVILYCKRCNASSFAYFKKTMDSCINKKIDSSAEFLKSVEDFVESKYKNKEDCSEVDKLKLPNNNSKTVSKVDSSFNHFKQREYDIDELEAELTDWYLNDEV